MMSAVGQTAQVEASLSIEDLEKMPDDCIHRELVQGELIELPPPKYRHARVSHRIHKLLDAFVSAHQLGSVFIEMGYMLRQDRRTWIQPDVSFLRASRVVPDDDVEYAEGAPDLAVEVISPSESAQDVDRKTELLLSAGTQEVWSVYRKTRTVQVRYAGSLVRIFRGDDQISSPLFPGWSVPVSRFFEDSD
ncbi:MAG: Uma2 family endonuclease [Bryobacteraceae bacterium]